MKSILLFTLLLSFSLHAKTNFLWVVDNSGSMGPIQEKILKNAQSFFKQLKLMPSLEWKMGIISTDVDDAPYLGFNEAFDNKTENAYDIFSNSFKNLGISGSGTELVFKSTIDRLNEYPSFINKDDTLILIIVTDEKEQSYTAGTEYNFSGFTTKLKEFSNKIKTVTVLSANDLEGCLSNSYSFNYYGSLFESLNLLFNGINISACQNIYDLKKLVNNI